MNNTFDLIFVYYYPEKNEFLIQYADDPDFLYDKKKGRYIIDDLFLKEITPVHSFYIDGDDQYFEFELMYWW